MGGAEETRQRQAGSRCLSCTARRGSVSLSCFIKWEKKCHYLFKGSKSAAIPTFIYLLVCFKRQDKDNRKSVPCRLKQFPSLILGRTAPEIIAVKTATTSYGDEPSRKLGQVCTRRPREPPHKTKASSWIQTPGTRRVLNN